jgi:phosphohistidine phosphatase
VRSLWILRHGKAASDVPSGGSDRERPLTGRGRRDATALGERLGAEDLPLGLEGVSKPELVICSAAVRTRQTADLIVRSMGGEIQLDAYHSLYEADTDLVLQYLREIDERVASAMVVGHNPTTYRLVWELLDDAADPEQNDGREALESEGFPTCALAVLSLELASWEDLARRCGSLAGVFRPPY